MTMNYCGRCGSANGTVARFCRQCGADLSSQTAFSSPSAPLNVEFSKKAVMKEQRKENKPTPPQTNQPPAAKRKQEAANPVSDEGEKPDPKAISESLRRIRTSGPLIIDAIKQKQDRIGEMISQSIENISDGKGREEPKQDKPPARPMKQAIKPVAENQKSQSEPLPESRPNGQSGIQAGIQAIAQTAAQTVASAVSATQTVARKTTGALTGSLVTRSNTGSLSNTGQLPPSGPSTVLAQASGLKPHSGFGSKMRVVLIALLVMVAAGTYFMYRDRLLLPSADEGDRNLVSPEEQSSRFVQMGESEREHGSYQSSIDYFRRALNLTPKNPDIRFMLAQTYFNSGQIDEALATYRDLLRIAPDHLEARLQMAEIYRTRGNWPAAYKEYQNIIGLDQNSGQAAVALDAIEKHESGQPDSRPVVKIASRRPRITQKGATELPVTSPSRNPVTLMSQKTTAVPGAEPPASLNSPPEDKPDPRLLADTHKKLGVRYLNVREYRAAINEFLQALRLTPDDKDLYYFVGSSYHGLGQHADAYEYYRRVDSGPYLGPAQSGTRQTEKAAREATKRREGQQFQSMKNEATVGSEGGNPTRPIANSFRE